MNLTQFEIQVINQMLSEKMDLSEIEIAISNCSIVDYEYTGAGYFLVLNCENLTLQKETIHEPVITGKANDLVVGFLLYTSKGNTTIECHNWGDKNIPEDIRDLDIEIIVDKN